MKKKVWILILLMILLTPAPIFARAGGGSSGSGSSGGGSSSSSRHHHYNDNHNQDPLGSLISTVGVVGVIILIPSIPMIVYRNRVRKKSKQTKEVLETIQTTDTLWKEEDILKRAEDIYFHVQEAWTYNDTEALKPYFSFNKPLNVPLPAAGGAIQMMFIFITSYKHDLLLNFQVVYMFLKLHQLRLIIRYRRL